MVIYIYGDLPEQGQMQMRKNFFTQTNTTISKKQHPIHNSFNQMIKIKLIT